MPLEAYMPALERMKSLFAEPGKKGCCIQVKSIADIAGQPGRPLNSWHFPDDNLAYLEDRAIQQAGYWRQRQDLQDDLVPGIYPYYGIAEHSAFLGGEVQFSRSTSYHQPMLRQLGDYQNIILETSQMWLKMFREGYQYYREAWSDQFFIKLRGAYSALDLANIVRGNELFYDFYDDPGQVHLLLDFCVKATRFYFDAQDRDVPAYLGGKISGFDVWLPGHSIGHLSEDTSCLCSVEQYAEFGLPYLDQLTGPFDHALLHTHTLGRKNLPQFVSLAKVDVIQISSDPKEPASFDIFREYSPVLQEKVVVIDVTASDLERYTDLIRQHRCILWYEAQDLVDARWAVDFVRRELS
jgi:hypothetical protein